MTNTLRCQLCGKSRPVVKQYHKGYQGQDYVTEGPEPHETPNDCIKYLAYLIRGIF